MKCLSCNFKNAVTRCDIQDICDIPLCNDCVFQPPHNKELGFCEHCFVRYCYVCDDTVGTIGHCVVCRNRVCSECADINGFVIVCSEC